MPKNPNSFADAQPAIPYSVTVTRTRTVRQECDIAVLVPSWVDPDLAGDYVESVLNGDIRHDKAKFTYDRGGTMHEATSQWQLTEAAFPTEETTEEEEETTLVSVENAYESPGDRDVAVLDLSAMPIDRHYTR